MTTFIWTTEYEVFVINRETVSEAREELSRLIGEYKDTHYPNGGDFGEETKFDPNYIIKFGESLLFDHANE